MPVNTTAIFSCSSSFTLLRAFWSVFLPDLGKYVEDSSILSKRGFTFYADLDFEYMNVSASEMNNGSHFSCREYDFTRGIYANSDLAYLTVVGE